MVKTCDLIKVMWILYHISIGLKAKMLLDFWTKLGSFGHIVSAS